MEDNTNRLRRPPSRSSLCLFSFRARTLTRMTVNCFEAAANAWRRMLTKQRTVLNVDARRICDRREKWKREPFPRQALSERQRRLAPCKSHSVSLSRHAAECEISSLYIPFSNHKNKHLVFWVIPWILPGVQILYTHTSIILLNKYYIPSIMFFYTYSD